MTPANAPGDPLRLPANEIEQLVIQAVKSWAADPKQVLDAVGWNHAKAAEEAVEAGQKIAQALAQNSHEQRARVHLGRGIDSVEKSAPTQSGSR